MAGEARGAYKIRGALAQLARAPALQAGCQGFESLRLHQDMRGVCWKESGGAETGV